MFRFSKHPPKQLLYLLLFHDMKASRDREIGIDVGCGLMQNRPLFRTRRYLAIDLDEDRLVRGRARYPEAETMAMRMEDVRDVSGDLVLCVQTFVNYQFPVENTRPAAEALVRMTRRDGTLIFNISKRNLGYEREIDALLADAFESVTKVTYGALAGRNLGPLSPLAAYAMYLLPGLRHGREYTKVYYRCEGRR